MNKKGTGQRDYLAKTLDFFRALYEGIVDPHAKGNSVVLDRHTTHHEKQLEYSSKERRRLIEAGETPSRADYRARRRAGLTK